MHASISSTAPREADTHMPIGILISVNTSGRGSDAGGRLVRAGAGAGAGSGARAGAGAGSGAGAGAGSLVTMFATGGSFLVGT